jgi:hypothetical protein
MGIVATLALLRLPVQLRAARPRIIWFNFHQTAKSDRHSGAMPTGPREARPDDRLRIEPGIQGFPDAQLRI